MIDTGIRDTLICLAVLIITVLAATSLLADTCTPSGDSYIRSYPPPGTTLNHLPPTDPRCRPNLRDTYASNTQLCGMCHPHKYSGRIG